MHSWDRRYLRHHPPRRRGIIAGGAIALLAAWAGAATLYPLFRDDALRLLADRQVAMRQAYDAKVARLEAEIESLRSKKLLDQERVERMVAELARRQMVLETRQSALATVMPKADEAIEFTGSLPSPAPAEAKPTPLSDTILLAPNERRSNLESRLVAPLGPRLSGHSAETAVEVRLANLAGELERLEAAQNRTLNRIEERYDELAKRMRSVLTDLALKPAGDRGPPSGGPFIPYAHPPDDPFARQLGRVRAAAANVDALRRSLAAIPVRRPTPPTSEVTSAFGPRIDPFLKQLAMHTGVDLRGEPGDPVRAAASGRVVLAERNAGYGLMVEIDHGNGITTRYAHLSAAAVSEGASVPAGAVIGRIGSSGRSTGPHLHYEIRVNGEPVDPQRFLRATLRLQATR